MLPLAQVPFLPGPSPSSLQWHNHRTYARLLEVSHSILHSVETDLTIEDAALSLKTLASSSSTLMTGLLCFYSAFLLLLKLPDLLGE